MKSMFAGSDSGYADPRMTLADKCIHRFEKWDRNNLPLPLKPGDWDFTSVTENELPACVLYEYSRECIYLLAGPPAKQSNARQRRKKLAELRRLEKESPPMTEEEEIDWQEFCEAREFSEYGLKELRQFLDGRLTPFSPPWAELPEKVRGLLCEMAEKRHLVSAIRAAAVGDVEELWNASSANLLAIREGKGSGKFDDEDADFAAFDEGKVLKDKGPFGETLAAFAIDFKRFTNKQILAVFAGWLKTNRPQRAGRRGKKFNDLRVALERLGIMRLLHHYTLAEMPTRCPEAWKLYGRRKWYDARKQARRTYKTIFPYDDTPLCWSTQGERNRFARIKLPAK